MLLTSAQFSHTTLKYRSIRNTTFKASMCYIANIFTVPSVGTISVWSSRQNYWLQIQRSQFRFPTILYFLKSNGSGTGSSQLREEN
jgi:hypothetical protein